MGRGGRNSPARRRVRRNRPVERSSHDDIRRILHKKAYHYDSPAVKYMGVSARKWFVCAWKWALRGKSVAELVTLVKDLIEMLLG